MKLDGPHASDLHSRVVVDVAIAEHILYTSGCHPLEVEGEIDTTQVPRPTVSRVCTEARKLSCFSVVRYRSCLYLIIEGFLDTDEHHREEHKDGAD